MLDLIRRPSNSLGLSTFEEMDNMFDNFWRSVGLPKTSFGLPSVDIYSQDDKHMVVEMQAPGFDSEDIELNVRNGVLEVRGEKTEKSEENKKNYMLRERHASFARRVMLPENADVDNISAELDKGLLKITMPVSRPEAKRIKVASKSSKTKSIKAKTDTS